MNRCRIRVGAKPTTLIESAIERLRRARDLLVAAGAPRSADRVRKALKSADGARRHAIRVEHSDGGGAA